MGQNPFLAKELLGRLATCIWLFPRSNTEGLEKAIDLARKQLQAVVTQVQTFLDIHQVLSAGPFLYTFIQEVR